MPDTGVVQRIAVHLIARLPTMAARDQHDARFVSAGSDWPDLDDDMRNIVYQRLNLYTIVATYGWPTKITSSSAVQAVPSIYCLRVSSLSNITNAIIRRRTSVGTGVTTRVSQQLLQLQLQHQRLQDEEEVAATINKLLQIQLLPGLT